MDKHDTKEQDPTKQARVSIKPAKNVTTGQHDWIIQQI